MGRRFVYDLIEHGRRSSGATEVAVDPISPGASRPLSVSEATRSIRRQLEQGLGEIWVEGEVSGLSCPGSGHWYFTLKDKDAQLRAVMFASANRRLKFRLEEGQAVQARGQISFYERGGQAQLLTRDLEPAGLGAQALALKQLGERLAAEGLFEPARKRPLPRAPRRLGVVTSSSGAAFHDVVKVARQRLPGLSVVLSPTRVQGEGAEREIATALERLDRSGLVDVIIVGRGGGSFEDLLAFSSERVVRAVAACSTPVVSAVGHEIDHALCDRAADARAATPSAAAELVVPVRATLDGSIAGPLTLAAQHLRRRLAEARLRVGYLRRGLVEPAAMLVQRRQDVDRYVRRAQQAELVRIRRLRRELQQLRVELERQDPGARLARGRATIAMLAARQQTAIGRRLAVAKSNLQRTASALDALSPLAVLGRGYAICFKEEQILRDAADVAPGQRIGIRLSRGQIAAEVVAGDGDDGI